MLNDVVEVGTDFRGASWALFLRNDLGLGSEGFRTIGEVGSEVTSGG